MRSHRVMYYGLLKTFPGEKQANKEGNIWAVVVTQLVD